MESLVPILLEQARTLSSSGLELTAVVLAVTYLLLAIRQVIWCWLCAGISALIYVYLFADAKLYMEAVLNGFYAAMALYGWFSWRAGRHDGVEMPVVVWRPGVHLRAVLAIAMAGLVNGFLLSRYTDAELPYVDSLISWAAVWATYLVARKVLENWWYWMVIDLVSVVIFWLRDLQLTSLLFVGYVIMIPFGLINWSRSMREEPA